jgi:hypothetical protein
VRPENYIPPGFELYPYSSGVLYGKYNRRGNTKFFARLNDLQIGQAKTSKKS